MKFLVLGAGALGGYFGARLLKGDADVTFLVRPGRAAQLRHDGLVVNAQDGEIRRQVKTVQSAEIDEPYDVILLCCKAYDLDGAMDAITRAMGERSAVLPLLNGVRHIACLKERFGEQRVIGGLTTINAALKPDGTILQSQLRINTTIIGELAGPISARAEAVKRALDNGGIPTTVNDNITAMLWMKFFAFTCIATISSLTRSRAGSIAKSAAGTAFVSAIIEECTRIATAEGFPPPPDTAGTIRGMFSQPDSTYGPSLLIDMEDGRPTEGEHTIGDMAERAARRGISAPILGAALCNLQSYEINRQQTRG